MSVTLKSITTTLDASSLEAAVRELNDFAEQLHGAMRFLVEHLAERGVVIAKAQLVQFDPPAFYTRQLYETIHKTEYNEGTGEGEVYVDYGTEYAIYVEYGTGIYGADIHSHGDEGWVYLNDRDGKWHWTKGMPARPFMYNTFRILEGEAEKTGAKIIAEYIP